MGHLLQELAVKLQITALMTVSAPLQAESYQTKQVLLSICSTHVHAVTSECSRRTSNCSAAAHTCNKAPHLLLEHTSVEAGSAIISTVTGGPPSCQAHKNPLANARPQTLLLRHNKTKLSLGHAARPQRSHGSMLPCDHMQALTQMNGDHPETDPNLHAQMKQTHTRSGTCK